jgi:hypothetical protein
MKSLRRSLVRSAGAIALSLLGLSPSAQAFPGLYVAKDADAELYNQTSQVVMARDGNRTTLTMLNDYEGNVGEFALIVPVPANLQPEQVRIVDPLAIKRIAFLSSPALFFDRPNCVAPCLIREPCFKTETIVTGDADIFNDPYGVLSDRNHRSMAQSASDRHLCSPPSPTTVFYPVDFYRIRSLVTTGEFETTVLNAQSGHQFISWLKAQGYSISETTEQALQPYIDQGMSLVVAQVNIPEFAAGKTYYLHPLQITYESPQFLLPIQLGKLNSQGLQEVSLHLLSSKGRAEVVNYPTVPIPSEAVLPEFVASNFGEKFIEVYQAILDKAFERSGRNTVLLESVLSVQTLTQPTRREAAYPDDLQTAGVSWIPKPEPDVPRFELGADVFFTGLKLRYSPADFPEDLAFYETREPERFEVRYNLEVYRSSGPNPEQAAEQCAASILEKFRQDYEAQLEHSRENNEVTLTSDFVTYLRGKMAYLTIADSPTFELLADYRYVDSEDFPFFREAEDPVDYIYRLSRTIHLQHEMEIPKRLEEEAQTLAELTGWPLDEIRRRITAEHNEVPESWRQRYPAPVEEESR